MINADVIFGVVCIAFSIFWIIMSFNLPRGMNGVPGPGYFPILLSIILIILSSILIYSGVKSKRIYFNFKEKNKEELITTITTPILIILFLIIWSHHVPYLLACFLFLLSLGFLYKINLKTNIISSLVLTVFTYFLFNTIFHTMLNL